jgi:predicted TIM-barrel fold metal-dependent hydrolase
MPRIAQDRYASIGFSRRQLLRRAALLATGGAALHAAAEPGISAEPDAADVPPPPPGAIDAHVHVWTPDVKRYPLAKGFSVADMQPPSFTPDQLLAEARPAGVSRVVLIQMNFYGFDNSYMLEAIRDYPGVFSGVATIDEQAPGLHETMLKLKGQGVRGFRIHPGKLPVEGWLFNSAMESFWKLGADENLAMCALVNPEALEPIDRMCARFPKTPVVIDHFARIGVDGTVRDADVERLCHLARHPNTFVKVSAYYALGKKQAPYTDLGPMIQRLLAAFGRERLMWATDCPYQVQGGHTYRDSIELIRSRLDFLTPLDKQWLLEKTAQRVFFA